jgi:hypothetical protein
MDTCETIGETEVLDMVRFNEAIDQALAESVVRYTADLDEVQGDVHCDPGP